MFAAREEVNDRVVTDDLVDVTCSIMMKRAYDNAKKWNILTLSRIENNTANIIQIVMKLRVVLECIKCMASLI